MSYSLDSRLHSSFTVAILAQGTSWAVAVTQAFLGLGSIPSTERPAVASNCIHPHIIFSYALSEGQSPEAFNSLLWALSSIINQCQLCVTTRACSGNDVHSQVSLASWEPQCNIAGTTLCIADGHTASNAPDLFRPPKLSGAGPGQYWGGGPPGKSLGCCQLFQQRYMRPGPSPLMILTYALIYPPWRV